MKLEKKTELLKIINSRGLNVLLIIIGTIFTLILGLNHAFNMPSSANMGALLPLISAPVYGVVILIFYLIFRNTLKDYSWLITVVGISYMIISSTNF